MFVRDILLRSVCWGRGVGSVAGGLWGSRNAAPTHQHPSKRKSPVACSGALQEANTLLLAIDAWEAPGSPFNVCCAVSTMHAKLLLDLWADALCFLEDMDLLAVEAVCRSTHKIVQCREMWRHRFVQRTIEHYWCLPSAGPIESWKLHYFTYMKELGVHSVEPRNPISGRFVWRCVGVQRHLQDQFDVFCSPFFEAGSASVAEDNPSQRWARVLA